MVFDNRNRNPVDFDSLFVPEILDHTTGEPLPIVPMGNDDNEMLGLIHIDLSDLVSPDVAVEHVVELYTERLVARGRITGNKARLSDLLNKGDSNFIVLESAAAGDAGFPDKLASIPTEMATSIPSIHIVATAPTEETPDHKPAAASDNSLQGSKRFRISKVPMLCAIHTGQYVINGTCHLHPNTGLRALLDGSEKFMPITGAVVCMNHDPARTWSRNLVLVNKEHIRLMYLVPQRGERRGSA